MAQRGGRLRISTKTLSRPTPTPEGREAVHPPTDTLRRPEETPPMDEKRPEAFCWTQT